MHVDTMALLLALEGQAVGRNVVLCGKTNTGIAMRDCAQEYFFGENQSGTLRAAWLADAEKWRADGHAVLRMLFTQTDELPPAPLVKEVLKRICAGAKQRFRKPRPPELFNESPGGSVRVIECNFVPEIPSVADDPGAVEECLVAFTFSDKRPFSRTQHMPEKGIFGMEADECLQKKLLQPRMRRAFFRYFTNFTRKNSLGKCASSLRNLEIVDEKYGRNLGRVPGASVDIMYTGGGTFEEQQERVAGRHADDQPNSFSAPAGNQVPNHHSKFTVVNKVHAALRADPKTSRRTLVKAYFFKDLDDAILPGLEAGGKPRSTTLVGPSLRVGRTGSWNSFGGMRNRTVTVSFRWIQIRSGKRELPLRSSVPWGTGAIPFTSKTSFATRNAN